MEPLTANVTPAKVQPELWPLPLVIFPECDPWQEEAEAEVEGLEVELMCSHLLLSASESPMAP